MFNESKIFKEKKNETYSLLLYRSTFWIIGEISFIIVKYVLIGNIFQTHCQVLNCRFLNSLPL